MIAIQTAALAGSTDSSEGSAPAWSWSAFAGSLDDFVCGAGGLETAGDAGFADTMPAVCWAVPGAYAASIDG